MLSILQFDDQLQLVMRPSAVPLCRTSAAPPLRHLCGHYIAKTLSLAEGVNADSRRLLRSALLVLAMVNIVDLVGQLKCVNDMRTS